MPVIQSLLDTDLYKFTMMQAVLHQYPAAQAEYRFRCRTPGVDLARHLDAISAGIDALCALRLQPDELDYLRGLRFIKPDSSTSSPCSASTASTSTCGPRPPCRARSN